eukprot:NODE_28019_length_492_cov_1.745205.p2 GENE.NODE_28019_length_492_cov_1.745205~~NODE_28019_length_492_cov_1.745205.p2  ORF type:complete len:100 (+),score=26.70 NODE_28019_length_492_cov_1.745205:57-356(+)
MGMQELAYPASWFCTVMASIALVLLPYVGLLCLSESPMIELPREAKGDAGKGCFLAATFYCGVLFLAVRYIRAASPSVRNPSLTEAVQMTRVSEIDDGL